MFTRIIRKNLAVLLICIVAIQAYSAEFVIKDADYSWLATETESKFSWALNGVGPADWTTPNDYWNGEIHWRIDVKSVATARQAKWQFVIWSDWAYPSFDEIASNTMPISSGVSSVSGSERPSSMYKVKGEVYDDFQNPAGIYKCGIMMWSVSPSSRIADYLTGADNEAVYADKLDWFPLQFHVTVVAVSAGSTFSGWSNYPAGGGGGGGTDPDPGTCTHEEKEHIDNSPTPSGTAIQAESMTMVDMFAQTLKGASGGDVATLWTPSDTYANTGSVSHTFAGAAGNYKIKVVYLDENDGGSDFRVKVNNVLKDSWTGTMQACSNKYTVRTLAVMPLAPGDVIKIEGDVDVNPDPVLVGAMAKVDYIDFELVSSSSMKIMPLGNSITFDQNIIETRSAADRGGYRFHLHNMLSVAGIDFDFVGSESAGQNLFSDPDNAGFPGISATQLLTLLLTGNNPLNNIQETPGHYLDAYNPKLIILEIGTNGFTTNVETLEDILDEIDAYKTRSGINAHTILCQIINQSPFHNPTSTYNTNIASLLTSRNDTSLHLVNLEQGAGLIYNTTPTGDMHDQLHPSETGYKKIAQLLVDKVLQVSNDLPSVPEFLTTETTLSVQLNENFIYNSHATASVKPVYSLDKAPAGMAIDAQHGVVTWTSGIPGEYTFDIVASNASGTDRQTIELSVGNLINAGYTEVFPLSVNISKRRAQAVVMPEKGIVQSISMYHSSGSGRAYYGIYTDNQGIPGTKLGETASFQVSAANEWQSVNLTSPVSLLAGQKVWLAWVYENAPSIYYGNGTPGRATTEANYPEGLPSDFGTSSVAPYQYSIYMSYFPDVASNLPPSIPTALGAIQNGNSVALSWTHDKNNTDGYMLERRIDGSPFVIIVQSPFSSLSYIDLDITKSGNYVYRVSAYNASGTSDYSNESTLTIDLGTISTTEIGNTSIFEQTVYNGNRRSQQITIPQDGHLQSISMYHGASSGNVLFAVYSDQNNMPGSLLATCAATPAAGSTGWQTINLTSPLAVTLGQKVWLAWVYETLTQTFYTDGTPGRANSDQQWASVMPASFGTFTQSNYVYSIYATLAFGTTEIIPPATPENLIASLLSGSQVQLSWNDVSNNETSFVLERRITGGQFTELITLGANVSTYEDVVPQSNQSYDYRVRAINAQSTSEYSNSATIVVPNSPAVYEVGYHSVFSLNIYNANRRAQKLIMPETGLIQQIAMYHGAGSGNVRYAVYSDNGSGPGSLLAQTSIIPSSSILGWQTASLNTSVQVEKDVAFWLAWVYENETQLFYEYGGDGRANTTETWSAGMPSVFGSNTLATTKYSIYALYTPVVNNQAPQAPSNLTASYNALSASVVLNWNDNSGNETSFKLEHSINGAPFIDLDSLGQNITTYTIAGLTHGNNYSYRVLASNSNGNSGYSNEILITATEPSSAPVSVGYTNIFDQQIVSAYRRAQQITSPIDGQLVSISMYHGAGSGNVLYGVYSDATNTPANLLSITPITTVAGVTGWQTITLNTPLSIVTGQKVWLAWSYQNGGQIFYTNGVPGRAHTSALYSGVLPNVFNAESYSDYIYSIYANIIPLSPTKDANADSDLTIASEKISFTLYPNPAVNGIFYVASGTNLKADDKIRIELSDITGRIFQLEERLASELSQPVFVKGGELGRLILVKISTQNATSVYRLVL